MLVNLFIYLLGIIFIGFPIVGVCFGKNLPLSNEMALGIILFYPIVAIVMLICGTIIGIKGLLDFIKLLFKGGIF